MTAAAKNNEIYHLWWHPHNFGQDPKNNLKDLKILLEHYKQCSQDFSFQSVNMAEINSAVKGK